jgi:hypothetical protein
VTGGVESSLFATITARLFRNEHDLRNWHGISIVTGYRDVSRIFSKGRAFVSVSV